MAQLIHPTGMTLEVKPDDGIKFTTEELQEFVGGYICYVRAKKKGHLLVVNEDGQAIGLDENETASDLADINPWWDFIVGNAVYCKVSEVE